MTTSSRESALSVGCDRLRRKYDNFVRKNKLFDDKVGKRIDKLDAVAIQHDIELLIKSTQRIVTYRNKFLAHRDFLQRLRKTPKIKEVLESVDLLSKLAAKYYLLTYDISYSYHPMDNYSGTIIKLFSFRWIHRKETQAALREAFRLNN